MWLKVSLIAGCNFWSILKPLFQPISCLTSSGRQLRCSVGHRGWVPPASFELTKALISFEGQVTSSFSRYPNRFFLNCRCWGGRFWCRKWLWEETWGSLLGGGVTGWKIRFDNMFQQVLKLRWRSVWNWFGQGQTWCLVLDQWLCF